ncbi:MAG TPA: cytochrome c [Bacteroidia bacterium]|jgi:hypothetical protein|nr:cytochrome c [Bacteroidia bacterium]
MKNKILFFITGCVFALIISGTGCVTPEVIADKPGPQLWGENCSRCHNAPGPGEFNNAHWDVIGMHMKVRAGLTDAEVKKIIDYLKLANNQ